MLDDAGIDAEIGLRRVRSEQEAQDARFLGSPTVRVAGRDVEPGAEQRTDYGIKCRLYRTPDGVSVLPSDQWIIVAAGGR